MASERFVMASERAAKKPRRAIPAAQTQTPAWIALTTHDGHFGPDPLPMAWGDGDPEQRGPVLATTRHPNQRNAIGAHAGSYSIYRGLAVAAGTLDPEYMPKLDLTSPSYRMGPFAAWSDPGKIVTIDPFGHMITSVFGAHLQAGFDIRPTIAVTHAHIELPEFKDAIRSGRLTPDGKILTTDGLAHVTKAAIEPVWYLRGGGVRVNTTEQVLRETLFKETNMMYPEVRETARAARRRAFLLSPNVARARSLSLTTRPNRGARPSRLSSS